MSRPPIDTTRFMSRYRHPKNIAAARGDAFATISTSYFKSKGRYRQKQVDDELDRIRAYKKPSSSKITITISSTNLLTLHHYHHRCLDVQLTSRSRKGRVVWFWEGWETAADERVMKGAIAALDSSWTDDGNVTQDGRINDASSTLDSSWAGRGEMAHDRSGNKRGIGSQTAKASGEPSNSNIGEKRKRAAAAAESRMGTSRSKQKKAGVIDLVDSD